MANLPNTTGKLGIPHSLVLAAGVALAVWIIWIFLAGPQRAEAVIWGHWPVALTMALGSFVAGASSEGGGAVAFPVFTKALGVAPTDAKLFALAIQSVGMSAASLVIFAMRSRIDWRVIGWATLGGAIGVTFCLTWIAPYAPAHEIRILFTAMQASFAVALIIATFRKEGRAQGARIGGWLGALALVAGGIIGGLASGLVGSGIDLVVFSMLVLLFRMNEKVATPTSVVLMALNSLVAMAFHALCVGPLPPLVHAMWLAAVPVVVVGAPLGAWVCSRMRRETIAWALVTLIAVEVATSLWLIPLTGSVLAVAGLGAIAFSSLYFAMARCLWFDPTWRRRRRVTPPLGGAA